jgi:hypothetical protein
MVLPSLLDPELHGHATLRYWLCAQVHVVADAWAMRAEWFGSRAVPWGAVTA